MKYMGSKAMIADQLAPIIHETLFVNGITTYIEPFVGGANMIDKIQCTNRYGYDINKYLIALLKHVQAHESLPDEITVDQYADCRAHYNLNDSYYPDWYIGAVGFLASFNGRFYDGGYARPSYDGDNYRDYYIESKNNLLEQESRLQGIEFQAQDYKDLNPHGTLIYADPPYNDKKGYSNVFKESYFWDKVREWSKDNIVLISEERAPEDFDILWEKEVSRTIKAQDKSKATEKLFIHHSININRPDENNILEEF